MVPTTAWEIGEFLDDKVLRKRLEFHARINEGEDWAISEKVLEDLPTVVIADGRLGLRSNKKTAEVANAAPAVRVPVAT